jgi:hypothetical protein
MMRLGRGSGIVALSLLAWAATASAECAWVLWGDSMISIAPASEPAYVVSAFDSRAACEAGRDQHVGQIVARKPKNAETSVDDVSGWRRVHVRTKGTDGPIITVYRYVCLPDTVDPRGPKGK